MKSTSMPWIYDDGGRALSGFKGRTGDCVTRSVAIATGLDYTEVYEALAELGRTERTSKRRGERHSHPRTGVFKTTVRRYIESLGWKWTPTMQIGSGCTVHLLKGELPMGRLIVSVSRHITAVIDGVVHDTHNPTRRGTRCVYGYWIKESDTTKEPHESFQGFCARLGIKLHRGEKGDQDFVPYRGRRI